MFKNLLTKQHTFPKIKAKNRQEMFTILCERAEKLGYVTSKEDLYQALEARENQGSTEVAPAIAMPHAKNDCVKECFIMIATSKKGVKYHGFSKVKLIFLLASPKDDPMYLHMMAKSARLLKKEDFVNKIIASDVPEDILSAIFSYEERINVSAENGKENMHMVMLTLNDEEDADIALPLFLELGIKNATILESSYLFEKIQGDLPFFAMFNIGSKKSYASKTIMGISEDEKIAGKLYNLLKEEKIDIWEPGKGAIYSFKLASVFGGLDPEIDI